MLSFHSQFTLKNSFGDFDTAAAHRRVASNAASHALVTARCFCNSAYSCGFPGAIDAPQALDSSSSDSEEVDSSESDTDDSESLCEHTQAADSSRWADLVQLEAETRVPGVAAWYHVCG